MEFDLPESVLEELQKAWKREWKKLTLADDFIFTSHTPTSTQTTSIPTMTRQGKYFTM